MRDRPRDEAMAEVFRDAPAYATALLNSTLEDGDPTEQSIVLRQIEASNLQRELHPRPA